MFVLIVFLIAHVMGVYVYCSRNGGGTPPHPHRGLIKQFDGQPLRFSVSSSEEKHLNNGKVR